MARILIIGASRGIGMATTRAALRQGYEVRAFARSAEQMTLAHPLLDKRDGDALDRLSVSEAVEGVDAVIQALGVAPSFRRTWRPVTLFSRSTDILLSAMRDSGVQRLLAVTGFGAGDSRNSLSPCQRAPFELLLGRAYADKDRQERLIRSSALDWTIVRPAILSNLAGRGRYEVLSQPADWRPGLISREDVAGFLIGEIAERRFLHQCPLLLGTPLGPRRRPSASSRLGRAPAGWA